MLALALLIAVQTAEDPYHVDFAVHSSPSGEWSLTVDPLEPNGGGPALYRMTRAGRLAYEEELGFTLSTFELTDGGYAIGYGYPLELQPIGQLHVVSLAPDGAVVFDERRQREASRFMHAAPVPHPHGLLVDGEHDVFGLRGLAGDDDHSRDTLWLYRISTGAPLAVVPPAALQPPGDYELAYLEKAQLLPGLGLFVLEWSVQGELGYGIACSLLDGAGATVWSLVLPEERDGLDEGAKRRLEQEGTLLAVEPGGRFALWLPGAGQRVDFTVARDAAAPGWRVAEVGRQPCVQPPEEPEGPGVREPLIELERLPSIELDAKGALAQPEALEPSVTRSGRLVLVDQKQRLVRAWDANGRALFETKLAGREPLKWWTVPQDGPAGTLLVQPDPHEPLAVQLDARGEELDSWLRLPLCSAVFEPDGACWAWKHGRVGIERSGADRPKLPVMRRLDRRWLRPDAAAVDPDGTLWVWSEDALCKFSPEGEPLEQRALPGAPDVLVLSPAWILCQARGSQGAVLVRRRDGAFFWHLATSLGQCAALAPSGDELWWLDPRGPRLDRYRLPQG